MLVVVALVDLVGDVYSLERSLDLDILRKSVKIYVFHSKTNFENFEKRKEKSIFEPVLGIHGYIRACLVLTLSRMSEFL